MSQYAIIESGSKQYKVEPNQIFEVELLDLPKDDAKEIALDRVLLFKDGDRIEVGAPFIKGAKVVCDYLGTVKGEKTISFKYRKRKASKAKKGHRQQYSKLRVKEITV